MIFSLSEILQLFGGHKPAMSRIVGKHEDEILRDNDEKTV